MRVTWWLVFTVACTSGADAPAVDHTGDTGPDAQVGQVGATWNGGVADLVRTRCVGCHSGDLPGGDLDLAVDPLGSVLEVPASQLPEMALVEPGDSLYSYLWHKVNGSQSIAGGSGTNMPLGAWLADSEIDLVARWIDAGCP
ncbi:MAG: hypothetical protein ACI8PZ_002395 [Myxococcota bacterium]